MRQQSHHFDTLTIHSHESVNVQLVAHPHHHLHIRKVNLVHVSATPTWMQVAAYPYRHKLLYPLVTNAHLQLSSFLFHWPFISTPSSDCWIWTQLFFYFLKFIQYPYAAYFF